MNKASFTKNNLKMKDIVWSLNTKIQMWYLTITVFYGSKKFSIASGAKALMCYLKVSFKIS